MTEHSNDRKDKPLEALYRDAGDVEPDAGIDRIIRARAGEAADTRRSTNRLPWLGGLVTASVAIVAIAVVLQQTPPGPPPAEAPEAADAEALESRRFMAPSVGADATLESSAEAQRARREMRQMQSIAETAEEAPPQAEPRPSAAALDDRANAVSEQDRPVVISERRRAELPDKGVVEPAHSKSAEIDEDPAAILARIESLIDTGEHRRALELLDAFRKNHPDHPIAEDIEKELARPE